MTRYIIKKKNEWSVVNANYKRTLKTFKTQKQAVVYAKGLESTSSMVLQGDDNKFRKITNWDTMETRKVAYVPLRVIKQLDAELAKDMARGNFIKIASAALFTIAIVFFVLFGMEMYD